MPTSRPIVILRAGDPVPGAEARRGPFERMIEETARGSWEGGMTAIDVRTSPPPDPRAAAAWIMTGSASSVLDREPWMLAAQAALGRAAASGVPVLGICFGHQMLAEALGGRCERNPRGREIGTVLVERVADDPLLDGLPPSFHANVTHIDTVARLPAGAVALARSERDRHMAVRFAPGVWGVQFHPEIDAEILREYVAARRPILLDEGLDVARIEREVHDAPHGAEVLRRFLALVPRG